MKWIKRLLCKHSYHFADAIQQTNGKSMTLSICNKCGHRSLLEMPYKAEELIKRYGKHN